MGDLGFFGAVIDEAYGGTGAGFVASVLMTMEIAQVSASWGLPFNMQSYFAAEAAVHAANTAMKILGSYGFSNEYPVGRLLRDAKSFQIVEGTSNI